jgi:hypothetical protein
MGWAKRDEGARIYRVKGQVRLYVQRDTHRWTTVVPFRADEWTVRRGRSSGDDGYVQVIWNGHIQETMGSWTTLCFDGASVKATEATDAQIMHALFCDQHIYDTGPAPTMPVDGDYVYVKSTCPVTFGGSAKRLGWTDLSPEDREGFARRLNCNGLNVEECRGLHRIVHT